MNESQDRFIEFLWTLFVGLLVISDLFMKLEKILTEKGKIPPCPTAETSTDLSFRFQCFVHGEKLFDLIDWIRHLKVKSDKVHSTKIIWTWNRPICRTRTYLSIFRRSLSDFQIQPIQGHPTEGASRVFVPRHFQDSIYLFERYWQRKKTFSLIVKAREHRLN